MADYYTVLKRAVGSLPDNTGQARRSVYEKARAAIIRQLEGFEPKLSPSEITRQRLSLEECIRKVEAEAARQSLGLGSVQAAPPPPMQEPPATDSEPEPSTDDTADEIVEGAQDDEPISDAISPKAPETEPGHSVFRKAIAEAEALGNAASQAGRSARQAIADTADDDGMGADARREPVLSGGDIGGSTLDDDATDQRIEPVIGDKVDPPADEDEIDPHIAAEAETTTSSRLPMIGGIVGLVLVVVAVGALIYSQRDLLNAIMSDEDRSGATSTSNAPQTTSDAQGESAPKNTDRLSESMDDLKADDVRTVTTTTITPPSGDAASGQDTLPNAVRNVTPGMAVSTPAADSPPKEAASSGVSTDAPDGAEPSAAAINDQTSAAADETKVAMAPADGGSETAAKPAPRVAAVAQGAILYEEGETSADKGVIVRGTVVWAVIDGAAEGDGPALQAKVALPDRNLNVVLTIKRNNDTALPASHLVEILFELPDNKLGKGIGKVPGLIMKRTEESRGDALLGASARVARGLFWIALSSTDAERERNETLLRERGWIDIPMLYENGKRAILTLEKGTAGDLSVEKALAAWASQ